MSEPKKANTKLIIGVVIVAVIILLGVLLMVKNKDKKDNVVESGKEATQAEVKMNKDFSSSFLVMDKASIADTKEDVIAALGNPEKEEEKDDLIPGLKVQTLTYDGGATIVTIRNGRVEQMESTNKERTFTKGLKVGSSKSEVEQTMPAGSRIQNAQVPEDSLVYSEVASEVYKNAKYIRFVINGGKVEKIMLSIGD